MGEVIEDYKNGLSLADLTQKYKCSKATIYRRFEEYRVKVRSKGGSERKSLPVEDIIKDCENGIPVRDLGAWHGVHHSTITSRIRESGVEVRNGKKEFPMGEVIMDYTSGLSYRKLADKYDSTPKTIRKRLKEHGVEVKRHTGKMELPMEEIIKDYMEGMTTTELGEWYGVSGWTIRDRLKRAGVKRQR